MTNSIKTYSVQDPAHPAAETLARRKELKDLTGCPHAFVIEGQCSEPGCIKNVLSLSQDIAIATEDCLWISQSLAEAADPFLQDIPRPIINTQARKWCVL